MKKNFKFINIFVIVVLLFTITSCTYEKTPNTESNHVVKYENINITDFNQMLEVANWWPLGSSCTLLCLIVMMAVLAKL